MMVILSYYRISIRLLSNKFIQIEFDTLNRTLSKMKVKMKTILVIVLILFIGGIQSLGQGIEFLKGDYNAALEKAKQEGKMLLSWISMQIGVGLVNEWLKMFSRLR